MAFSGLGSGIFTDPYQITTLAQLDEIRNNLTACYKLMNNIDASATTTWNSGNGWIPIGDYYNGVYSGTFFGNGKKITNLRCYNSTSNNTGFFGCVTDATITKLGLENVDFKANGINNMGGIIGIIKGGDYTDIEESYVTGVFSTDSVGNKYCGGVLGKAEQGLENHQILNCWANVNITAQSSGAFGGFCGMVDKTTCNSCYSISPITGTATAKYGFCGYNGTSNNFYNCYWDKEASGLPTNVDALVTGLTTVQAKQQASYWDWDFVAIWGINSGQYPGLRNVGWNNTGLVDNLVISPKMTATAQMGYSGAGTKYIVPIATATAAQMKTPGIGLKVVSPVAIATENPRNPGFATAIYAAVAQAQAQAKTPTVQGLNGQVIAAPVATGTAAGVIPVISAGATITAPVATGTAGQVLTPQLKTVIPIPIATGTAQMTVPGLQVAELPPIATATAQGNIPVISAGAIITIPVATGLAQMPQVVNGTVQHQTVTSPVMTATGQAKATSQKADSLLNAQSMQGVAAIYNPVLYYDYNATVTAPRAQATGGAIAASFSTGSNINSPSMTATGTANTPIYFSSFLMAVPRAQAMGALSAPGLSLSSKVIGITALAIAQAKTPTASSSKGIPIQGRRVLRIPIQGEKVG